MVFLSKKVNFAKGLISDAHILVYCTKSNATAKNIIGYDQHHRASNASSRDENRNVST